jgi:hypothetical protein
MNPKNVRRIPVLIVWVLIKRNIKIGAIIIAIPMVGTISLLLVNINIPKPRKNHKTGRLWCFIIWSPLSISSTVIYLLSSY